MGNNARIVHSKVSRQTTGPDAQRVYGSDWNDDHVITGLGNVDNTSDADKPVSTATQAALSLKADASDLATVATSGAYADLSGKPTLGTAAAAATTDFATAAQGVKADTALQGSELGVSVAGIATDNEFTGSNSFRGSTRVKNSDFSPGSAGSFVDVTLGATSGDTFAKIQAFTGGGTTPGILKLQPVSGDVDLVTSGSNANVKGKLNVAEVATFSNTLNITTPTGTTTRAINTWSEGPSTGTVPGNIQYNQMYGSMNAPMSGTDIPNGDGSKSWSVLGVYASVGPNFVGVEAQAISGGISTTGATLTTSDLVAINMGVMQNYTGLSRIYGSCFAATVGPTGSAPVMISQELGSNLENSDGVSVPYRLGLNIINYGLYQAGTVDTAISIMGGNPGGQFKNVITLVQADSDDQSIDVTGSIIAAESTQGEQTIGSVINLTNVNITDYVFNTKHSLLTGAGVMTLGDTAVEGGLALKGPTGGNVHLDFQLGSGVSQWTFGIDGTSSDQFYIYNPQTSTRAFHIDHATNKATFDADMSAANLPDGAWATYTPTPAAATGTGTWSGVAGRYKKLLNKTVTVSIVGTLSAVGTAGGAYVSFSLPFAAASHSVSFIGIGRETGSTGTVLQGVVNAGASVVTLLGVGAATPIGTGCIYNITLTYEAA